MITTVDEANKNLGKRCAGIDTKECKVIRGTITKSLHPGNALPLGLMSAGKTHRFKMLYELDSIEDMDELCQELTNRLAVALDTHFRYTHELFLAHIMMQVLRVRETQQEGEMP